VHLWHHNRKPGGEKATNINRVRALIIVSSRSDITGAELSCHFDLDLTLGQHDQPVADIGGRQPIMAHPLFHGVGSVLQVDQDHPERLCYGLVEERAAACHCQRLDDRQRAFSGTACGGGASDFADKLGIESPTFMPGAGLFRLVVLSPRRLPGIDRQPGLKPAAGRSISRLMGDELIATSGRAMH
jgi:hypothetical protein